MALTVEDRLQRLEDIEAIKAVKSTYARHCDNAYDPDGISSLFTEGGTWEAGPFGRHEGKAAIREFFAGVSSELASWALHYTIDPVIELSDDGLEATGQWYLLVLATMPRSGTPGTSDAVLMSGQYHDTFVKTDGRWWFTSLRGDIAQVSDWDQGWVKQPFR